jgi:hypothetical protein
MIGTDLENLRVVEKLSSTLRENLPVNPLRLIVIPGPVVEGEVHVVSAPHELLRVREDTQLKVLDSLLGDSSSFVAQVVEGVVLQVVVNKKFMLALAEAPGGAA